MSANNKKPEELPWDLFDRCLLPIIFSHAAAVIISTVLNTLRLSDVSCFNLFVTFLFFSLGFTLFYHNLYVSAAGKGVLITSCDNVVGYSLASQLDDLGFTVYAGFPNKEQGRRLKEQSSGRMHVVELDLSSEKDMDRVYAYIENNLPPGAPGLWAIINNTTWVAFGEFEWLPPEVYRKSIEINFVNMIQLTQLFLSSIRTTRGRIINVTSILGRIPLPTHSPLCSMKAAIEQFSQCIRLELKRYGIDVVVVEPGSYTTGLWFNDKKILQDAKKMWKNANHEFQDFGDDYFEYKIRSLPEYINPSKDANIGAVTRSIVDATSRTFPLNRYTPVTRQEKIQVFVAEHLPSCIYRILYS